LDSHGFNMAFPTPAEWIQPPKLPIWTANERKSFIFNAWLGNQINFFSGIRAPKAIEYGFYASAVLAFMAALYFLLRLISYTVGIIIAVTLCLAFLGMISEIPKKRRLARPQG
jgi:hypothetical protein